MCLILVVLSLEMLLFRLWPIVFSPNCCNTCYLYFVFIPSVCSFAIPNLIKQSIYKGTFHPCILYKPLPFIIILLFLYIYLFRFALAFSLSLALCLYRGWWRFWLAYRAAISRLGAFFDNIVNLGIHNWLRLSLMEMHFLERLEAIFFY